MAAPTESPTLGVEGQQGGGPGPVPLGLSWAHQFGSILSGMDFASSIAIDAGDVYVAGQVDGELPGQPLAGGSDAFVRKYNGTGDEQWTEQFGTAGNDAARSIALDPAGQPFVAGLVTGTLPGETSAGGQDAFVRKYDGDGTVLWTRQFGSTTSDSATGVAVNASAVFVAGWTFGVLPGQVGIGGRDGFVRMYETDGTEAWTRQFGTSADDFPEGIALSATGVYVVGETSGVFPGQTGSGGQDAFLVAYDLDGNLNWTRQFGSSNFDIARAVAAPDTSVYVLGSTFGTLPGQVRVGDYDAYLRKYDADGNEQWTRQFGTTFLDVANGLTANASGAIVGGVTQGTFPGQTRIGGEDAFLRRYDAAGTELTTLQFGTTENDNVVSLTARSSGDYAIAGGTWGAFPGQASAGLLDVYVRASDASDAELWTRQFGTTRGGQDMVYGIAGGSAVYVVGSVEGTVPGQSSAGQRDAFLAKYDGLGNRVWVSQFGASGSDEARAVALGLGGPVVAGSVNGALPGQTSYGDLDAFVRQYDENGNILWTDQFGDPLFRRDASLAVAADATGVYVAGYTTGALPGQTSAGGGSDAFLRRYDLAGAVLWTRQFGTSGLDEARGVAVDASGTYVVGTTSGAFPGNANAGGSDAFVRKYDFAGNEVWTWQFGTAGADAASSVALDASGGVFVGGNVDGSLPGQVRLGGVDGFVRRYDPSGVLVWTHQFGTSLADSVSALAASAGTVYAAGATDGIFEGQAGLGGRDLFVYGTDGSPLFQVQLGTAARDEALALDLRGGIYLGGLTEGAFPGETGTGGSDGFVAQLVGIPPSAPQALEATEGNGAVSLSWRWPTFDGGSPITAYRVYRGLSQGTVTFLAEVPALTYDDVGLANGQTYHYRVSAVNSASEGPLSASVSATPRGPPSAPQRLEAMPGDGRVGLAWEAPVTDGGAPIAGFRIYRGLSPGSPSLLGEVGPVLTYADATVTNGVAYYYGVAAFNAFGEGPPSTEISATPAAAPTAPRNLAATGGVASITLAWQPPADDGGLPVTSYRIYGGTSSGSVFFLTEVAPGLSYTDVGVAPGVPYYYQVRARNAVAEGPSSNEASATALAAPDTVPPVLTITEPTMTLTAASSVTVAGVTEPGATLSVAGSPTPVAADGTFSTVVPLLEGPNAIPVVATDPAGNRAVATVSITRDSTPPTLAILTPSDGALLATGLVRVGGTVVDTGSGVASLAVHGLLLVPTSSWGVDVALADGPQVLVVSAADHAGNVVSQSVTVTIDTVAPPLVITSPTSELTRSATVTIAGTTEPAATVTIDGSPATVDGAGAFSVTVTWSDGLHTVSVLAHDPAGNERSATLRVRIDTSPPPIEITSPSDGTATKDAVVQVEGLSEAGALVVVNGIVVQVAPDGSFLVGIGLADGANVIRATAIDEAGNLAGASVTVTYANPANELGRLEQDLRETRDQLNETQRDLGTAQEALEGANAALARLDGLLLAAVMLIAVMAASTAVLGVMLVRFRRKLDAQPGNGKDTET